MKTTVRGDKDVSHTLFQPHLSRATNPEAGTRTAESFSVGSTTSTTFESFTAVNVDTQSGAVARDSPPPDQPSPNATIDEDTGITAEELIPVEQDDRSRGSPVPRCSRNVSRAEPVTRPSTETPGPDFRGPTTRAQWAQQIRLPRASSNLNPNSAPRHASMPGSQFTRRAAAPSLSPAGHTGGSLSGMKATHQRDHSRSTRSLTSTPGPNTPTPESPVLIQHNVQATPGSDDQSFHSTSGSTRSVRKSIITTYPALQVQSDEMKLDKVRASTQLRVKWNGQQQKLTVIQNEAPVLVVNLKENNPIKVVHSSSLQSFYVELETNGVIRGPSALLFKMQIPKDESETLSNFLNIFTSRLADKSSVHPKEE